jgi:Ca2+-dependent lipid-binding protein
MALKAFYFRELPLLRHDKLISNLNVDMRYFPVSKPIENPDGTMIEAAPSSKFFSLFYFSIYINDINKDSGVLRITLHECRHLGYNNKVNPFANIKINGVDRFTTPTFKRTSNPKFERAYEILVLDKTEVYIRVSFIDSIAFADDAFLGAWTGYLHDIMERQEENEYWWDLKSRTGKPRMRMSVQWKPVVMSGLAKMGGSSKGIYSPPQGIVRFSFWNAKDLPSGNNDPYVRVRSGNQIRARTESLDNSQNPEWGEHQYVPIHSIHENLVLEVVDWSSGSKDKLLGSTVFELKELVQLKEEEGKGSWLEALTDTLEK